MRGGMNSPPGGSSRDRLVRALWVLAPWLAAGTLFGVTQLAFTPHPKRPGDACSVVLPNAECADDATELACEGDHYVAVPCRGPRGCQSTNALISCDVSEDRDGDRCTAPAKPSPDAGFLLGGMNGSGACSGDGKAVVVCEKGTFRRYPCRGAEGCHADGARQVCDTSVAEVGDPCRGSATTCALDHARVLTCRDGRFAVVTRCDASPGCEHREGQVACSMLRETEEAR
jgi:hypothetical protein